MSDLPDRPEITIEHVDVKAAWSDILENGINAGEDWNNAFLPGLKDTFLDQKTSLPRVRVLYRAPIEPEELPCVTIGLNSENQTGDHVGRLEEDEDYEEDHSGNPQGPILRAGDRNETSVELRIWTFNEIERDRLYRAVYALAKVALGYFDGIGAGRQSVIGGRDEQMPTDQTPKILYTQTVTWTGDLEFSARIVLDRLDSVQVRQVPMDEEEEEEEE